jgi:hypothetical protein
MEKAEFVEELKNHGKDNVYIQELIEDHDRFVRKFNVSIDYATFIPALIDAEVHATYSRECS